jgi:hypothetical protein
MAPPAKVTPFAGGASARVVETALGWLLKALAHPGPQATFSQ